MVGTLKFKPKIVKFKEYGGGHTYRLRNCAYVDGYLYTVDSSDFSMYSSESPSDLVDKLKKLIEDIENNTIIDYSMFVKKNNLSTTFEVIDSEVPPKVKALPTTIIDNDTDRSNRAVLEHHNDETDKDSDMSLSGAIDELFVLLSEDDVADDIYDALSLMLTELKAKDHQWFATVVTICLDTFLELYYETDDEDANETLESAKKLIREKLK